MNLVQDVEINIRNYGKCKISFTGTHGTGKTTSVFETALLLKKHFPKETIEVFMENAKYSPLPINKNTTFDSQLWIFTNQIQKEIELMSKSSILVTDRTCVDSIAYTCLAGHSNLANAKMNLAHFHIQTYNLIYFKRAQTNQYCFADGLRVGDDDSFRMGIELKLDELYTKLFVQTISV